MTYGISVTNTSGNLQIDSDKTYSYLKVVQKGTGTSVTNIKNTQMIFALGSPSASSPAAVTYYGCHVTASSPSVSPTSYTYTFVSNRASPATMNYMIVEPTYSTAASTSGYGLQIFNVDGNLAFDSNIFTSGTATGDNAILIIDIIPGYVSPKISGNYGILYSGSDYNEMYVSFIGNYYIQGVLPLQAIHWNSTSPAVRFYSVYLTGGFPPTQQFANLNDDTVLAKSV